MKTTIRESRQVSFLYMLFTVLFCICLITANLLETKQIQIGNIYTTAGILVFPLSYIINDCVCEVWGYKKTMLMVWIGFAMNLIFVIFGAIADAIPAAPFWNNEEGFHAIFGLAPRIVAASFIAFLAGSFVNAKILSKMKAANPGRKFSVRAIVSTIFGESADSAIFFPIAFLGVIPCRELLIIMITQIILKTLYEILVLPITAQVVKYAKVYEMKSI